MSSLTACMFTDAAKYDPVHYLSDWTPDCDTGLQCRVVYLCGVCRIVLLFPLSVVVDTLNILWRNACLIRIAFRLRLYICVQCFEAASLEHLSRLELQCVFGVLEITGLRREQVYSKGSKYFRVCVASSER